MTDSGLTHQLAPLPTALTSFVGREHEIASLLPLLQQPNVRLVTLTGPGGVGKTRLALRVAHDLQPLFTDGVAFVPLAPITDPDLVGPTMAHALQVQERGDRPIAPLLVEALRDRHLLLILDNFEQVVEAAPLLTELLVACPGLRLLVTSRILLRLSGEHEVPVRPLSLPDPLIPLPHQGDTDAVRLFVERARTADPTFTLTADNAQAIAAICQRLDGLPLALELVAAKVRVFSPQALLPRLATALPLLTGGRRDDPVRLQTMRNAITWSYDLLHPEEQRLFHRLAVFAGGFTLDAAEAVTSGLPGEPGDVFLGIEALVDQSLIRRVEPTGMDRASSAWRFGMLETMREFGLERLDALGETADLRERHAAHFLALAEVVEPHLMGPGQSGGLARLDDDLANLRAALQWLLEQGNAGEALRMAVALAPYWYLRWRFGEGRSSLESALALSGTIDPALRARALARICTMADWQANYEQAVAFGEAAVAMWRELDDPRGLAEALMTLGLALIQVDVVRAETTTMDCVALYRSLDDDLHLAEALDIWGICAYARGDYVTATARMEEGLLLARRAGDPDVLGTLLGDLGHASMMRGDHERARELLGEGLVHFRGRGHRYWIAWCLASLGGIAIGTRPDQAVPLFAAATIVFDDTAIPLRPFIQDTYAPMLARARTALGEAGFAKAWARGQAFTQDEAIAAGFSVVHAGISPSGTRPDATATFGLTPREAEVLRLVAAGHSNREIADALFISVPTVKRHISTILGKLDLPSRPAAVAFAHTHGLA